MYRRLFISAAVFLCMIIYFCLIVSSDNPIERVVFYVFQTRDLQRAVALLSGHIPFFGPEMTGGGNLPGSLYYFILAIPLAIAGTWKAAWGFMILLTAIAGSLAGWFLWTTLSLSASVLFLTLLAYSPETQNYFHIFLNPSFAFVTVIPAIIAICQSVAAENLIARKRAFWLACLLLGLALQFHFSNIALLAALAYLQLTTEKKLSAREYGIGVGLLALPLLPWVAWTILDRFSVPIGQTNPFSGRQVKSILTLIDLTRELSE